MVLHRRTLRTLVTTAAIYCNFVRYRVAWLACPFWDSCTRARHLLVQPTHWSSREGFAEVECRQRGKLRPGHGHESNLFWLTRVYHVARRTASTSAGTGRRQFCSILCMTRPRRARGWVNRA